MIVSGVSQEILFICLCKKKTENIMILFFETAAANLIRYIRLTWGASGRVTEFSAYEGVAIL